MTEPAPKRTKGIHVGAPACFVLEREIQFLNRAFDGQCYLVGSALERPDWRDIDVRMIMRDEAFTALFPDAGPLDHARWEFDPRWIVLTTAMIRAAVKANRPAGGFPVSTNDPRERAPQRPSQRAGPDLRQRGRLMRLTELDPCWLTFEGRRVGFIFRCPLPAKRDWWQTCFVEKFYLFKGRDGTYNRAGDSAGTPDSQCGIVDVCAPAASANWQGCNSDHQWTVAGGIENASFESLTVSPSIDGSAGGNWHGFITNGEIVGGI